VNTRIVRVVAVVASAALALAACSGSSKSASPTTVAPFTTSSTGTAAGQTAAGKPWVDALVRSATSAPNRPASTSPQQVRCVANAIVDTFGAAAFPAAGYTIAKVSDPNSKLNALPVTNAELDALGRRVQSCRLGELFAPQLAAEFPGTARPTTNACIASHLDADTSAGRFLALGFLSRDPDRPAARALVDVLAGCVNFAAVAAQDLSQLTPTERACVAPKLAASPQYRDIIAEEIVGAKPTPAELIRVALQSMAGCVSAPRLAQLGRQP
jgi:hypothetical protein